MVKITEKTYGPALVLLDRLIDGVGTDESHHLYSVLDSLGDAVIDFERDRFPTPVFPKNS